jgi:sulfide dehydrogenase [flavocytochrome c] flavoprotein chain
MPKLSRRRFGLGLLGAGVAATSGSGFAFAQGAAKILIIGGGPGGASVAGQLKRAAPQLDVTLVEPLSRYTSCFFSNYYMGGARTLDSLTHTYVGLEALGVKVIHEYADAIDTTKRIVRLRAGRVLGYDRLVVAPGIDFKIGGIEGYGKDTKDVMPHAWSGRAQLQLLRSKLVAMPDGGVIVMAAPRMPYRCPPGPYERVCVIANYLKTAKPKSKLILLDPKMTFSKQPVFMEVFNTLYKDIVEVHLTNDIDDQGVKSVNAATGEVVTKAGLKVVASVANIIPDQTAGRIAMLSGLAEGDWCPVKPDSFASVKADNVYVLGDAAFAAEMPKSAYAANSQARVVSAMLLSDLAGTPKPAASYRNTCWSFLAPDNSAKIGADYAPGEVRGKPGLVPSGSFVSQPGEAAALRKEVNAESFAWYDTLTNDIFQKDAAKAAAGQKARKL